MEKSGLKEGEDWIEPNQSLIYTHTPFSHTLAPIFFIFASLKLSSQKKSTI